jgi:hypothetical protein
MGGEFLQAGGGDVVDAIALFHQPLVAIVEGGEGHVAQAAVGGVDQVGDPGSGQIGLEGFDQPA